MGRMFMKKKIISGTVIWVSDTDAKKKMDKHAKSLGWTAENEPFTANAGHIYCDETPLDQPLLPGRNCIYATGMNTNFKQGEFMGAHEDVELERTILESRFAPHFKADYNIDGRLSQTAKIKGKEGIAPNFMMTKGYNSMMTKVKLGLPREISKRGIQKQYQMVKLLDTLAKPICPKGKKAAGCRQSPNSEGYVPWREAKTSNDKAQVEEDRVGLKYRTCRMALDLYVGFCKGCCCDRGQVSQVLNTRLLTPDRSQWPSTDYPVKNKPFDCGEWFKMVDSSIRAYTNMLKVFKLQTIQTKAHCLG